jgi:enoyl-CoA hydratase/carnithine racemase
MNDHPAAPAEKILTRKEGGVWWVIYNQPEKKNAISLDMSVKVVEVLDQFAADDAARVLIVMGAGNTFVSGADISEFESKRNDAAAAAKYAEISNRMFSAMREVAKPTIAMIEGFCFGGGVALAACCDIRLAAEDALFSIPAAKLGLGYRVDFTQLLVDLIGPSFTKEMLYTGRRFTAAEAAGMGLVNRVVPKAELDKLARDYAKTIAENAPLSVRTSKAVVGECLKDNAQRDLAMCERLIDVCSNSEDYKNARRAFMEKKKPAFTGR